MENLHDPKQPTMNDMSAYGGSPGNSRLLGRVLVVEDDEALRESLRDVLEKMHCKVEAVDSGEEALRHLRSQMVDLVLLDNRLPGKNGLQVLREMREADEDALVVMMTAFPEIHTAVRAMKEGAYDYINKPFELEELRLLVQKALETRHLKDEMARLRRMEGIWKPETPLWGECPRMQEIRNLIEMVSRTPDTTVLVQGESGTGKELVANAIHALSARRERVMMKLNCSGIPETLLESELFGHEKGSFTDARTEKKGLIELADGGTLFLDEVCGMSPAMQPKLLRMLEERVFRRVGGSKEIHVDVRVIAATNRDLKSMVAAGEFREDLFYRLNVMTITLPRLRERGEDILALARLFLARQSSKMNKKITDISPASQQMMLHYAWPGNVRELANVIERGIILAQGSTILPKHLPIEVQQSGTALPVITPPTDSAESDLSLEAAERTHIAWVLQLAGDNKSEAARRLGISRSTLLEKLKKISPQSGSPD